MNDETEDRVKARNVSELVFPRDYGGNLGAVKKETLKAISQMNGNIDKYRSLRDTLGVLAEFAETRMRIQLETRKSAVASLMANRVVDSTADEPEKEDEDNKE